MHVLRNAKTDIPVTSRGYVTKHVYDVLPFKRITCYLPDQALERVRAIMYSGLACILALDYV